MDIFGVVVFIVWLISNMAALPIMAAILTDEDAYFFVPLEIWHRLRLKFSKNNLWHTSWVYMLLVLLRYFYKSYSDPCAYLLNCNFRSLSFYKGETI